jgi:hypothetical protein
MTEAGKIGRGRFGFSAIVSERSQRALELLSVHGTPWKKNGLQGADERRLIADREFPLRLQQPPLEP